MRSLTKCLLSVLFLTAFASYGAAQAKDAADKSAGAGAASKEEVEQLRKEVAEQRQTIEELKAMVQQLVASKTQGPGDAQVVNAVLVQPDPQAAKPDQKPAEKPASAPLTAGWNGDHFFIKAGDFQLQPYGYLQADFRVNHGDGVPPNTFLIRKGRFGFLGNFGKYYDYAVLIDAAATNGISLRDMYLNIKPFPEFQVQVGQFKEPFAQEVVAADTNTDFIERSNAAALYPAASSSFRSPGVTIHGDIKGGVMQYWLGAFNGKGVLINNTTNEPEVLGRIRFYPWKNHKDSMLQGFAFGGSLAHGRTRGLSAEQSFSSQLQNQLLTLIPTFTINGPVERWNVEGSWTHKRWAIRSEYNQLMQFRRNVGSEDFGGIGFVTLPAIVGKGGYAQATYMITGETRPEFGSPKVAHPVLGPGENHGWGAWEVAFRYDKLQVKEPGLAIPNPFTPGGVPTFQNHLDSYTVGLNWYLNNWIKYQANFEVDRLAHPSTTGQLPQDFFVFLQRLQFRF